MVEISKDEAAFLRKKAPQIHVTRPTSNRKVSFVEESALVFKLLDEFREMKNGKK